METCMRGFSNAFFMDIKPDADALAPTDMQYTETDELARTWKASRRQRLQQQEDRIWQDFVKEGQQDVLKSVQKEPYQFLQEVPQSTALLQLVDEELRESLAKDTSQKNKEEDPMPSDTKLTETPSQIFHIYDDEKEFDNNDEQDDNKSIETARTVRERECSDSRSEKDEDTDHTQSPKTSATIRTTESKSCENITDKIECSVYCAKVKDLRQKIQNEFDAIMTSLEGISVSGLESEEVRKLCRRSAEFCSRFHRIYEYQLQRQMQVINRHNSTAPPLGKHTQFHSQMTRIGSLHQGLLQALQVFHKSVEQTLCLGESCTQLLSLVNTCRSISEVSAAVSVPPDFCSADNLYDDTLGETCAKVKAAVQLYSIRVSNCVVAAQTTNIEMPRGGTAKREKKAPKGGSGGGAKSNMKLSMYSKDQTSSRRPSRTTVLSKIREEIKPVEKPKPEPEPEPEQKPGKKKGRRRPRMRDPQEGVGKSEGVRQPRRTHGDLDVSTVVEGIQVMQATTHEKKGLLRGKSRSPKCSRLVSPNTPKRSPQKQKKLPQMWKTLPMPLWQPPLSPQSPMPSVRPGEPASPTSPKDLNNQAGDDAEASRLVNEWCGGDSCNGNITERVSGARNAKLVCVDGDKSQRFSPRKNTPQILKLLEKTIKQKTPRRTAAKADRVWLSFDIPAKTCDAVFKYRTKFVQHMLTSSLYANSVVGKPWEMIGSVSEQIIDDMLVDLAKEMEHKELADDLYWTEIL